MQQVLTVYKPLECRVVYLTPPRRERVWSELRPEDPDYFEPVVLPYVEDVREEEPLND